MATDSVEVETDFAEKTTVGVTTESFEVTTVSVEMLVK